MNTNKSSLLYAEALELLPGGVDSPVRAFRSVGGDPLLAAGRQLERHCAQLRSDGAS